MRQDSPPLSFNSEPALTHDTYEEPTYTAVALHPGNPKRETPDNFAASYFTTLPYAPTHFPSQAVKSDGVESSVPQLGYRRLRSTFWWNVQLIVAVLLGVAIYAAIDGWSARDLMKSRRLDEPNNPAAPNSSRPETHNLPAKQGRPAAGVLPTFDVPIPSEYGIYAVSNGKLTELDILPIKIPDQRVAISPLFSTPSRVHLPAGELQFVAFRRDLVNNAPDRITVRVVARVVRALNFNSGGTAAITEVAGSWVVRSNSYQMKVAPVSDNPEMIIIRADQPQFALPAGRYALVVKGTPYDFTLDGPQADAAHCLERTDALNGPVYTECRSF